MSKGLSYFPLDVNMSDEFELIVAEYGCKGFTVLVRLFQKIIGGYGYYCEWTKDVALLFAGKNGLGYSVVSEIVSAAIGRGIFDREISDKYNVLTSEELQHKYFRGAHRRKVIEVKKEYLLVQVAQKYENVVILGENADISAENVYNSEQIKLNEVKLNEIKLNKINEADAFFEKTMDKLMEYYSEHIGEVTQEVYNSLAEWLKVVDENLIIYAIDEAVKRNAKTLPYINGIIRTQAKAGNRTATVDKKSFNVYKDNTGYDYDRIEEIMHQKYDK